MKADMETLPSVSSSDEDNDDKDKDKEEDGLKDWGKSVDGEQAKKRHKKEKKRHKERRKRNKRKEKEVLLWLGYSVDKRRVGDVLEQSRGRPRKKNKQDRHQKRDKKDSRYFQDLESPKYRVVTQAEIVDGEFIKLPSNEEKVRIGQKKEESKTTRETPRTEDDWIAFIQQEQAKGSPRERLLAIYERGLKCFPTSTTMLIGRLKLLDPTHVNTKAQWERAFEEFGDGDDELCFEYLEFHARDNVSNVDAFRLAFIRALNMSLGSISRLDLLGLYCCVLREAGFVEMATGVFQAVVEYSLDHVESKRQMVEFWESGAPKFGESVFPNGYRAWVQAKRTGTPMNLERLVHVRHMHKYFQFEKGVVPELTTSLLQESDEGQGNESVVEELPDKVPPGMKWVFSAPHDRYVLVPDENARTRAPEVSDDRELYRKILDDLELENRDKIEKEREKRSKRLGALSLRFDEDMVWTKLRAEHEQDECHRAVSLRLDSDRPKVLQFPERVVVGEDIEQCLFKVRLPSMQVDMLYRFLGCFGIEFPFKHHSDHRFRKMLVRYQCTGTSTGYTRVFGSYAEPARFIRTCLFRDATMPIRVDPRIYRNKAMCNLLQSAIMRGLVHFPQNTALMEAFMSLLFHIKGARDGRETARYFLQYSSQSSKPEPVCELWCHYADLETWYGRPRQGRRVLSEIMGTCKPGSPLLSRLCWQVIRSYILYYQGIEKFRAMVVDSLLKVVNMDAKGGVSLKAPEILKARQAYRGLSKTCLNRLLESSKEAGDDIPDLVYVLICYAYFELVFDLGRGMEILGNGVVALKSFGEKYVAGYEFLHVSKLIFAVAEFTMIRNRPIHQLGSDRNTRFAIKSGLDDFPNHELLLSAELCLNCTLSVSQSLQLLPRPDQTDHSSTDFQVLCLALAHLHRIVKLDMDAPSLDCYWPGCGDEFTKAEMIPMPKIVYARPKQSIALVRSILDHHSARGDSILFWRAFARIELAAGHISRAKRVFLKGLESSRWWSKTLAMDCAICLRPYLDVAELRSIIQASKSRQVNIEHS